jgi:hypothetical protein
MFDKQINVLTNEVRTHEWTNVTWIAHLAIIHMSNVFSMHDISAWNVRIMNELMLHDFHFKVVRCYVCDEGLTTKCFKFSYLSMLCWHISSKSFILVHYSSTKSNCCLRWQHTKDDSFLPKKLMYNKYDGTH